MEKLKLNYRRIVDKYGEYYLPEFGEDMNDARNDTADTTGNESDESAVAIIGKYGIMRERYLKEHRKVLYTELITHGELRNHLITVEREAQEFRDKVVQKMAMRYGVTEELKGANPMKWVGMMNNINASVDEVICAEIIYV
jgi:hypothetical protein